MCVVSGIQFIQTLSSKFQEFVPEGSFMTRSDKQLGRKTAEKRPRCTKMQAKMLDFGTPRSL